MIPCKPVHRGEGTGKGGGGKTKKLRGKVADKKPGVWRAPPKTVPEKMSRKEEKKYERGSKKNKERTRQKNGHEKREVIGARGPPIIIGQGGRGKKKSKGKCTKSEMDVPDQARRRQCRPNGTRQQKRKKTAAGKKGGKEEWKRSRKKKTKEER